MSYERMEKRAAELEAEVARWLNSAEAADAGEDKLYGRDRIGEEMPDWVADKKRRGSQGQRGGRGRGKAASQRPQEAGSESRSRLRWARSQSPEELY
jgi:hypothetical protein